MRRSGFSSLIAKWPIIGILIIILSLSNCSALAGGRDNMTPPHVEEELLVKFHKDVSHERANDITRKKGGEIISFIKGIRVYHIKLRAGHKTEDAVKEFSSLPEVEYAEPNYKVQTKPIK